MKIYNNDSGKQGQSGQGGSQGGTSGDQTMNK